MVVVGGGAGLGGYSRESEARPSGWRRGGRLCGLAAPHVVAGLGLLLRKSRASLSLRRWKPRGGE